MVAGGMIVSGAHAQGVPAVQDTAAALAHDARSYAEMFDVTPAEAASRLAAQEASVAETDKLAAKYADRLAGIAIEHRPDWRIIVSLTGERPVAARTIEVAGRKVPIEFRTGAKATREQVSWAVAYHQQQLRAALPAAPAMGLDPRSGELVVALSPKRIKEAAVPALAAKLSGIAGVPVRIRLLDRFDANAGVPGGARLEGVNLSDGRRYACTAGFVVTDGERQGVVTAAHCVDSLAFTAADQAPLKFSGQWGWGYRDVQLHLADRPLDPLFFADTKKTEVRPVTAVRGRSSTRAGDFVCHRGERTGYSCGTVELVDFAPAGDLCGGACLPTWVAVSGANCKGGDSGGPVFIGTTALGILKGGSYRPDGSCALYFYMSLDYLPAGWHAATN